MSTINIHDIFVPIYLRGLQNLSHILSKGEVYTKQRNIPEAEVMDWRLAPDMEPLTFQVVTACNAAENLVGLIRGTISPTIDNNLKTFAELHSRIARTIDILQRTTREQFEGHDMAYMDVLGRWMTGLEYVQKSGMPNFFFHVTVLYSLLRSHGAPLGKGDYLRGGSGA